MRACCSIKTGACPEDCKYCPQSAHYAKTPGSSAKSLLDVDEVLAKAGIAKDAGATRFCMGAAWREVKDGAAFDSVLDMVRGVRALGMEACVTLGMLTQAQADRLAEAGLTAYNHNLDTSPEFYGEIITTRTYQDRLDTLQRVRRAGITGLLRRHHRHGREHRGPRRGCCRRSPISIRIRRACRSTRWSPCQARRCKTGRRSIRSSSCAWSRRRAS